MPIVYQKNIDEHTSLAVWKIEETEERSETKLKRIKMEEI